MMNVEFAIISVVYLTFTLLWDHNNWKNTKIKLANLTMAVVAFEHSVNIFSVSYFEIVLFYSFSFFWNYLAFKNWRTDSRKNMITAMFLVFFLIVQPSFGFTAAIAQKYTASRITIDTIKKVR